jgi:hypothetical protein
LLFFFLDKKETKNQGQRCCAVARALRQLKIKAENLAACYATILEALFFRLISYNKILIHPGEKKALDLP